MDPTRLTPAIAGPISIGLIALIALALHRAPQGPHELWINGTVETNSVVRIDPLHSRLRIVEPDWRCRWDDEVEIVGSLPSTIADRHLAWRMRVSETPTGYRATALEFAPFVYGWGCKVNIIAPYRPVPE